MNCKQSLDAISEYCPICWGEIINIFLKYLAKIAPLWQTDNKQNPMISGTVSLHDYLNAQRLHRADTVRWYYLASLVVFVIGVVLLFFNQRFGLVLACAGIGGGLGELIAAKVYLPWKGRHLYAQQKNLASPFTYKWDAVYLEAQSVHGQSKRRWEDYAKYKENGQLFLLYHADNLFEMLPKSWFKDEAQISEFRKLAKATLCNKFHS